MKQKIDKILKESEGEKKGTARSRRGRPKRIGDGPAPSLQLFFFFYLLEKRNIFSSNRYGHMYQDILGGSRMTVKFPFLRARRRKVNGRAEHSNHQRCADQPTPSTLTRREILIVQTSISPSES